MKIALIVGSILAACIATLGAAYVFRFDLRNAVDATIPYVICAYNGDQDRAIAACTRVIARGDREKLIDRVSAFYNRGVAYDAKGQPERALADYGEAIRLDPNHGAAYDNRGTIRHLRGDLRGAIADYDQAIRIDPGDAFALNNRANAYADQGDTARALADYDRLIRMKTDFPTAHLGRGRVHETRGEFDAALADIATFRRLRPSDPRGPEAEARVRAKLQGTR